MIAWVANFHPSTPVEFAIAPGKPAAAIVRQTQAANERHGSDAPRVRLTRLAVITTNAQGSYKGRLIIPPSAKETPGLYTLYAIGLRSHQIAYRVIRAT
jgi:hypothetical protein